MTSDLAKERDIVYCVHLHLDTTTFEVEHPTKADHMVYRVEGKSRPMLVVRESAKTRRGRKWFLAIPITSKGKSEDGNNKPAHYPIGKLPGSNSISYLVMNDVRRLPDNMIVQYKGRQNIIQQLDALDFSSIIKIASHYAMHL